MDEPQQGTEARADQLAEDCREVYRQLRLFGPQCLSQLAGDLGLKPKRVRRALYELLRRGLVIRLRPQVVNGKVAKKDAIAWAVQHPFFVRMVLALREYARKRVIRRR